jgi:hypothetical protein
MSDATQLFSLTRKYCTSKLSFKELYNWIQDREEYWSTLPKDDPARFLAGTFMLAAYEVQAGDRTEESARKLVAETLKTPAAGA